MYKNEFYLHGLVKHLQKTNQITEKLSNAFEEYMECISGFINVERERIGEDHPMMVANKDSIKACEEFSEKFNKAASKSAACSVEYFKEIKDTLKEIKKEKNKSSY